MIMRKYEKLFTVLLPIVLVIFRNLFQNENDLYFDIILIVLLSSTYIKVECLRDKLNEHINVEK